MHEITFSSKSPSAELCFMFIQQNMVDFCQNPCHSRGELLARLTAASKLFFWSSTSGASYLDHYFLCLVVIGLTVCLKKQQKNIVCAAAVWDPSQKKYIQQIATIQHRALRYTLMIKMPPASPQFNPNKPINAREKKTYFYLW